MSRWLWGTILLLALLVVVLKSAEDGSVPDFFPDRNSPESEISDPRLMEEEPVIDLPPTSIPEVESDIDEPILEQAPPSAILKEQIQENPHRTPPALLQFARSLGQRMEVAKSETREAEKLLGELDECLQAPSLSTSVQALCLKNAKRLGAIESGT